MSLAPICLFTYNRPEETRKTINALKNNDLAKKSDLIVFSDAAKDRNSIESVANTRKLLKDIDGFKSVNIVERKTNYGLAKSIITGVTEIIEKYGQVIVLEDDLITSKNFITYMNQGLEFYKNKSKVWSISGFSFPASYPPGYKYDSAFGVRASSWGWATWADRWNKVDWNISDYSLFLTDKKAQQEFREGGSDLCKMLNDQMTGKINSWAIRFCYAQFRNKALDVYPKVSKVINIGFGCNATHTKGMKDRFYTELDITQKTKFNFSEEFLVDPLLLKQYKKNFSIITRLKHKLFSLIK